MAAYTGHQNHYRKLTKQQRHELGQIAPVAQTHAVCADCGGDKGLSKTTRDGQVISVCASCKVAAMKQDNNQSGEKETMTVKSAEYPAGVWPIVKQHHPRGEKCRCGHEGKLYSIPGFQGRHCWMCLLAIADNLRLESREVEYDRRGPGGAY